MPSIHFNKQLLIAGLIFTLHNTEEAFGFRYFRYSDSLLFHLPTADEMIPAIVLITLIAWIAIIWVCFRPSVAPKRFLLTTLVSAFLINAFIPHIIGTIYLGCYFPAVITAVLLYLPYVYWMLPRVYNEFDTRRSFLKTVAQGISLALLAVFVTQFASYLINLP